MSRTLWIFRKDATRLLPQIAAFGASLALFALVGPTYSRYRQGGTFETLVVSLLYLLLPLTCCLLVIEAIHQEAPVGHEQYWLTRPFTTRELVLAKALFVAAFVNLPVLLCQAGVLLALGFPPEQYGHVLLAKQVFLTALLLLPAAAFAAISKGWGRTLAAGFLMLLPLVVLRLVLAAFTDAGSWGALAWIQVTMAAAVAAFGSAAVLWLQYRYRATTVSRGLLAATAVAALAVTSLPPWSAAFALQRLLSGQTADAPAMRIAFDSARGPRPVEVPLNPRLSARGVPVSLPVRVENIPIGMDVAAVWVWVEIDGARVRGWLGDVTGGAGWLSVQVPPERLAPERPARIRGAAELTLFRLSGNVEPCRWDFQSPGVCITPLPRVAVHRVGGDNDGWPRWPIPRSAVYAPYPTSPWFGVLERFGMPVYTGERILGERPVGHVRREFDFGAVRLADYVVR